MTNPSSAGETSLGSTVPSGYQSLGEGRKLEPYGTCANSPDGKHHYAAVSCVQSVEHFVCAHCLDEYYD